MFLIVHDMVNRRKPLPRLGFQGFSVGTNQQGRSSQILGIVRHHHIVRNGAADAFNDDMGRLPVLHPAIERLIVDALGDTVLDLDLAAGFGQYRGDKG